MRRWQWTILAMTCAMLSGCASDLMTQVPEETQVTEQTSVITFWRNNAFGAAIQAPVAEGKENEGIDPVGIVSHGYKVRYVVEPGDHYFVVGGESSSLLKATVQANKHYYVQVMPVMGIWKARFALMPLNQKHLADPKVRERIAQTRSMRLNEAGQAWYVQHEGDMIKKLKNAQIRHEKAERKKGPLLQLMPEDGIDEAL